MEAHLKTGTLALVFSDGDNGINEELQVGNTITKKFTIENIGTLDGSLSLDWKNLINTYQNGSLSYSLTYKTSEESDEIEILPEANMPTSSEALRQILAGEISVPAGQKYYYNLNITLNNTDVDQTGDLDAIFTTEFDVDQAMKYRYYTLSVDPNGGTWKEFTDVQDFELQNNDTLELPVPTKIGYTFKEWEIKGTSSRVEDNKFYMGIENTKITAMWKINSHTVKVDVDGNETTYELNYGESLDLTPPTKEGYTFTGWSASSGTINGNTFTLNTDEDVTITANFNANNYNYKVIHRQMNTAGTDFDVIDVENGSLSFGSVLNPEVKTYAGFKSPEKQSKTIVIDEENPVKNIITYDYEREKYTLTIDPNGGSYTGSKSVEMYFDSTTDIPNPSRDGYTFSGWDKTSGEITGSTFRMGDSNSTITAKWTANEYDYIVYHKKQNTDGSTFTTEEATSGKAPFDTTISPNVKTYTGFMSPSKGNLTIKIDNNVPPTLNVLNYQYLRNKYNLILNLNGGTSTDENKSMFYETSITLKTPTKAGYSFVGWTNTGGTLEGSTFTMSEAKDSSVSANWQINQYKYTVNHYLMNTDGSTYTLESSEENTVDFGTEVTPGVKTYTGFEKPTVKSLIVNVDEETNKIDYYYARKEYTLTINPNGGTYSGSTTLTKYYGENVAIESPTKTGYNYSWSKTGEGTLSGSTFTMGNGNATLTANWTAKTFTITFNGNGGTPTTQSKTVTYDSKYILPDTEPTYNGYKFLGWFTASSGGTQVTTNTDVKITGSQTLYAHWEGKQYTVTFNANGGTTPSKTSMTVTYRSSYGTLPTTTRSGYTFLGWYTSASGGSNITSSSTVNTAGNHTLYAQWKSSKCKITYSYDVGCENTYISGVSGGTTSDMETVVEVACGSKVSSVPTLHNYECYGTKQIFFGWLTSTRDVFDTNYVVNSDIRVYPELDLPKYLVCRDTNTACEELYYSQYTYCSGCSGCPSSGMYYPSSHTVLRCGGSKKQAMDSPAGSSTPSDYYTNSPGCHVSGGTYGGTLASGTSVPGLYKIGGTIYHYHNTCCDQGGRLSGGRCV